MDVLEMKSQIAEIPAADAKDTAEVVRNWSNDKAFQVGMHIVRGNLSPDEAKVALSNLADASITTVLAAVVADFADRRGPLSESGLAAILLGDLAAREAFPEAPLELLLVYDGLSPANSDNLCKRFGETLAGLTRDSLIFSPPENASAILALPLGELAEYGQSSGSEELPDLTRTRCVYEAGDSSIGSRSGEILEEMRKNEPPPEQSAEARPEE